MDAKIYYKKISTLDVFPTIAQSIGVDLPENVTYGGYSMYDWIFTKVKNHFVLFLMQVVWSCVSCADFNAVL